MLAEECFHYVTPTVLDATNVLLLTIIFEFFNVGPYSQPGGGLEQRHPALRGNAEFRQVAAQFIGQDRPLPNQRANPLPKLLFVVLTRNFEHRADFVIRVGGVLNSLLVN
jgi:hypothetical protein